MSSTRSTQNSHRGTDFGIAAAYMQGHETGASTAQRDEAAAQQPIPDLFESDIESTQFPIVSERTVSQSQSTCAASTMGATDGDTVHGLPHGNAERDVGPTTLASQQPHDDAAATTREVGGKPKTKAAPRSKFGLEDVRRGPANVDLGPIRPTGLGKKRSSTLSPQRTSGRKQVPVNLEPLLEEPTPHPEAAPSNLGDPIPVPEVPTRSDATQGKSSPGPTSPTSIVPPSPTAEAQMHAAATIESLADRVMVLEKIITERFLAIDDRLQVMDHGTSETNRALLAKLGQIEERSHDLSERLTELEIKLHEWRAPKSPQTFSMSTPQGSSPAAEKGPQRMPEAQPVSVTCGQPPTQQGVQPAPTMVGMPQARQEMQNTSAMSGRPLTQSFTRHFRGEPGVKFSERSGNPHGQYAQNPWTTQPDFGFHAHGPAPTQTTTWAMQHPQTPVISSSFGAGKSLQKEVTYVIDRKNAGDLPTFSGRIIDYEKWVEKVIEHLCSTCSRWRNVLDTARRAHAPHDQYQLLNTQIDGFNAWEIAVELGQCTFRHLHSDLYEDKYALCGGPELNGFELWRNLEKRYGGGGRAVEVSGLAAFMSFPKCDSENNLVPHLARWEEYLNRYGSERRKTPESLRVMLLQVLPKEMSDKLGPKRAKYPTFQSILAYVRERYEERRELAKAEAIHLPLQTRKTSRVAAVSQQQTPATYASVAARPTSQQQPIQVPSMEDLQNMMAAVSGVRTHGGRSPASRFIFKGCWECGKDGHSRHECPQWKKILVDGKPPPGHKGAKDKALAKYKAERAAASDAKPKNKINYLGEEVSENNTEDEDNGDEQVDEFGLRHMKVMMEPVKTSNSFAALADVNPGYEISEEVAEATNNFAHRLHVGKKTAQRSRRPKEDFHAVLKEFKDKDGKDGKKPVILRSAEDLDRPDVKRLISPLPEEPERINRLATLCPPNEEVPLLPGEQWVLFDTGASCNAINVSRDCPEYTEKVRQTRNSMSGRGAESASGGSIPERGEVTVDMLVDGNPCQMTFKDMEVSMPISSGRACVGGGDTFAVIHKNGGSLKNITSGKEIKLYARQGVYFFKATILTPGTLEPDLSSPFARRG